MRFNDYHLSLPKINGSNWTMPQSENYLALVYLTPNCLNFLFKPQKYQNGATFRTISTNCLASPLGLPWISRKLNFMTHPSKFAQMGSCRMGCKLERNCQIWDQFYNNSWALHLINKKKIDKVTFPTWLRAIFSFSGRLYMSYSFQLILITSTKLKEENVAYTSVFQL